MKVQCEECGIRFKKPPSQIKKSPNHFCSCSCAARYNNRKNPKRKRTGKCRVCGNPILSDRTFCSPKCRNSTYLSPEQRLRYRREINKKAVVSFRQRQKLRAVEYKGGSCCICGYNRCVRSFDFHHVDAKEKSFGIGCGSTKSWDRVRKELTKCVLLCRNCHGEVHDGMVDLTVWGDSPQEIEQSLAHGAGVEPAVER